MTERIKSLLDRTFAKEQAKFRRDIDWEPLTKRFIEEKIGDEARARIGLEKMLKAEIPLIRLILARKIRFLPESARAFSPNT